MSIRRASARSQPWSPRRARRDRAAALLAVVRHLPVHLRRRIYDCDPGVDPAHRDERSDLARARGIRRRRRLRRRDPRARYGRRVPRRDPARGARLRPLRSGTRIHCAAARGDLPRARHVRARRLRAVDAEALQGAHRRCPRDLAAAVRSSRGAARHRQRRSMAVSHHLGTCRSAAARDVLRVARPARPLAARAARSSDRRRVVRRRIPRSTRRSRSAGAPRMRASPVRCSRSRRRTSARMPTDSRSHSPCSPAPCSAGSTRSTVRSPAASSSNFFRFGPKRSTPPHRRSCTESRWSSSWCSCPSESPAHRYASKGDDAHMNRHQHVRFTRFSSPPPLALALAFGTPRRPRWPTIPA